jgi:hypothetical protein
MKKPIWKTFSLGPNKISVAETALFLTTVLKDPWYGPRLWEELCPLVLPGNAHAAPGELEEAVLSLTRPFWDYSAP